MKVINAAVVGLGRMGAFTSQKVKDYAPKCWFPLSHLESLKMINRVNVTAICDQSSSLVEKVSAIYGVTNVFIDAAAMLEASELDLVCVATRTPGRAELIGHCIENGVSALHIEKPLCNSLTELRTLKNLVEKKNTLLTYGTLRRYFEVYKKAKDLLASGRFGDLVQIDIAFGHSQLFWTHPHSLDIVLFFAGDRRFQSLQAILSGVELEEKNNKKIILSDPYIEYTILNFDRSVTAIISKNQGMDVVLTCTAGRISILADGSILQSQEIKGDDPYLQATNDHSLDFNIPQGTYSALIQTVDKLQTTSGSCSESFSSLSEHIFLGHKLLFLIVQSHLNNGAQVSLSELDINLEILAKSDQLYA